MAQRYPDLVRRVAAAGHEIACHGYSHTPLWQLDRKSFGTELRSFREAIRDALGEDPVRGFRAPTFSIDRSTAWALEVLAEEGFDYDSRQPVGRYEVCPVIEILEQGGHLQRHN